MSKFKFSAQEIYLIHEGRCNEGNGTGGFLLSVYFLMPQSTEYHVVSDRHSSPRQDVFLKQYVASGSKVQKDCYSVKLKVNVTRPLIFVSFERAT